MSNNKLTLRSRAGRDQAVQAEHAAAVTPNDSTNLSDVSKYGMTLGLYIGTTGTLTVIMASGATVTFTSVAVGFIPLNVVRVLSTGTTASNIVALY